MDHLLFSLNNKPIFSIPTSSNSILLEITESQLNLTNENELLYHSKLKSEDVFTVEFLNNNDPRTESYKIWKGEGKEGDSLTCRN